MKETKYIQLNIESASHYMAEKHGGTRTHSHMKQPLGTKTYI